MFEQITIAASFNRKLPSQVLSISPEYRPVGPGSDTTKKEDPPRAYFEEVPKRILDLVTQARINAPQPSILTAKLPVTEATHLLHTESDVLRATYLYLLHPVNIAARRLIPDGVSFECRGEVSGDGSRTDIQWIIKMGNAVRNIAVLEVKNTNIIRKEDFFSARATPANAAIKIAQAMNRADKTFFNYNAFWLSKQAKKYHTRLGIPHIAIFDWYSMFIFDFSRMNEDVQPPTLAKGTYMREADSNSQEWTFRRLLLGFLIRALIGHNIQLKY